MGSELDYWAGPDGMLDLCSGLALLSGYAPDRFRAAMEERNAEEAEHLTAVALGMLAGREKAQPWMAERWERLRLLRLEQEGNDGQVQRLR